MGSTAPDLKLVDQVVTAKAVRFTSLVLKLLAQPEPIVL